MKISQCVEQSYQNSVSKGFYERPTKPTERFQLMLSEVAEATEEYRSHKEDFYLVDGKPEGQAVEFVDVLIRIFDYSGFKGINLSKYIEQRFFTNFSDIETLFELMKEVKDLKNIKCYNELENLNDDLEYHLSVSISIAEAGKSYLYGKNDDIIFLHLSDAVVKIARIFFIKKWDLEKILEIKHSYNLNRSYKHGGKVC